MKRVVITGPTGALGMALIQELINNEIEVAAVCHPGSLRIAQIPRSKWVKVVECDLKDMRKLKDMLTETYDVFYHFGWAGTFGDERNNPRVQAENIQYTLDAAEVAKKLGCTKFIGAGSQAEYGRFEGKLRPDTPAFPENGYGMAKLCAGQISRLYCRQLKMEHVWVRVLSVYGPYDGDRTMVSSVIRELLEGRSPDCTLGQQQWDYLYSKDAGRAFSLLGEKGINEKIYCLGSGKVNFLSEYIEQMRNIIAPEIPIGFGKIPYSEKQVMYLCADISELRQDTGFVPEYTFKQGITETIKWWSDKVRSECQ